ncbi:CG14383 [Drosophila busckii]|uniref:CG14383 n=1 Tax=Drosophila busckii TaxID=30019 RepID=A0A0M4F631_DROBS|nr:uncharacterized protein LOC108603156 [Drosophila busckii]ALC47450.1 CG14383 [Drosophila busckii]
MAEEFALSEEKLDELFVKEVRSVTKIIDKLSCSDAIVTMCTRWFQIFQQATPKEKFSRNFMLLLLHKQLNDRNALGYPFTDVRNCQRDLRTLHQMSLNQAKGDSFCSVDDDACETCNSLEWSSIGSLRSSEVSCGASHYMRLEDANRQLIEQNAKLLKELKACKAELQEQQEQREQYESLKQILSNKIYLYEKETSYMKDIFAGSAVTTLEVFAKLQLPLTQPNYFHSLLSVLCENTSDEKKLQQLDSQFAQLLHAHMDKYIHMQRPALMQQVGKDYDGLRSKFSQRYNEVFKAQTEAQLQLLSLTAMRYLTLLRKLFLDSFKGQRSVTQAVLKFLNDRYKELSQNV